MNNRLLDIIKYKTGGRQKVFAELLGWTPQYLAKLLRGENFGLQPVLTLLEKLPEIDARWLLLGEGSMLNDGKISGLRRGVYSSVQRMMDYERFMPVMFPDELKAFEECISEGRIPNYSDNEVWEFELRLRALNDKVEDAMSKSITPCKHPKAKQS